MPCPSVQPAQGKPLDSVGLLGSRGPGTGNVSKWQTNLGRDKKNFPLER